MTLRVVAPELGLDAVIDRFRNTFDCFADIATMRDPPSVAGPPERSVSIGCDPRTEGSVVRSKGDRLFVDGANGLEMSFLLPQGSYANFDTNVRRPITRCLEQGPSRVDVTFARVSPDRLVARLGALSIDVPLQSLEESYCHGIGLDGPGRAAISCITGDAGVSYEAAHYGDTIALKASGADIDGVRSFRAMGAVVLRCGATVHFSDFHYVSRSYTPLEGPRGFRCTLRVNACQDACKKRFATSRGERQDEQERCELACLGAEECKGSP